ncbi:MAG: hypothetical protein ABI663_18300 [Chryseolinea sp.]
MTTRILGTILTVIILFIGCQTKSTTDQVVIVNADSIVDNVTQNKKTTDSVKNEEEFDYSECIRGQAASVIKKTVYPNSTFKLNKDNHTGTETIDLVNGDKLIINNWGCEYYVLTFRFETTRFQADTTDIKYWLDKAVILMNEIEKGLDAPLDTPGGTLATKKYLDESKTHSLGEEIAYDDDVIRDFVTFDRVQKISDTKYAIEISYATGPL